MDENNQEFTPYGQPEPVQPEPPQHETVQPPQQYYQPGPAAPQDDQGNGLAIASLVCGILGIVLSLLSLNLFVAIPALVLAILAVVFGVKARKTAPPDNRGMATAGLVLGIVALGIAAFVLIVCTAVASCVGCATLSSLNSFR